MKTSYLNKDNVFGFQETNERHSIKNLRSGRNETNTFS